MTLTNNLKQMNFIVNCPFHGVYKCRVLCNRNKLLSIDWTLCVSCHNLKIKWWLNLGFVGFQPTSTTFQFVSIEFTNSTTIMQTIWLLKAQSNNDQYLKVSFSHFSKEFHFNSAKLQILHQTTFFKYRKKWFCFLKRIFGLTLMNLFYWGRSLQNLDSLLFLFLHSNLNGSIKIYWKVFY